MGLIANARQVAEMLMTKGAVRNGQWVPYQYCVEGAEIIKSLVAAYRDRVEEHEALIADAAEEIARLEAERDRLRDSHRDLRACLGAVQPDLNKRSRALVEKRLQESLGV